MEGETTADKKRKRVELDSLQVLLGEREENETRDGGRVDWEAVRERLRSHPEDTFSPIDYIGYKIWVLDAALDNEHDNERPPPADIIAEIIKANPHALVAPPDSDFLFSFTQAICPLSTVTSKAYYSDATKDLLRMLMKETMNELEKYSRYSGGNRVGFLDLSDELNRRTENRKRLHHPFGFIADGGNINSDFGSPDFAAHEAAVQMALEEYPEILGPHAPPCLDVREIWHLIFYEWQSMRYFRFPDAAIVAYWERTQKILKVAHQQSHPKQKFSPLHILIENFLPTKNEYHWDYGAASDLDYIYVPGRNVGCQYTTHAWLGILKQTLKLEPEQFSVTNEKGDLPLHSFLKERFWVADPDFPDDSHPPAGEILDIFIEAYPEALGIADSQGSLPLVLACHNYWPIDKIIAAEPRAIATRNLSNHFHPFLCVRTNHENPYDKDECLQEQEELRALTACYELLRSAPEVLNEYQLS